MFFDRVRIYCKAGNGGNGAVSFRREKYISHGGPDGGDGGNGGNIIFRVDEGADTLLYYKYKRKFRAGDGGAGEGSKRHGAKGEDLILPLPRGTVIMDADSGLIIHDMSDGEDFVICKGGRGGWGNKHFATPTRQIPRFAKSGMDGQERELLLEMKIIADVGLIGLPNVGKSSILSMISASRPKIGNYNFTTLSPNLGVVAVGDEGKGFVAADIPGLIEGASEGAGLGHEFLRHVERCRLLIHVVDASAQDGASPVDNIKLINNELKEYSEKLADRPQIIAANKCDCLTDEEPLDEIKAYAAEKGILRDLTLTVESGGMGGLPAGGRQFGAMIGAGSISDMSIKVVCVSAATGMGLKELINETALELSALPPCERYEAEYVEPEIPTLGSMEKTFTIRRENEIYVVESEWLYRVMGSINFDDRESLNYFQKVLRTGGVIDALREKGVTDGDTVSIYDFEFEFVN